MQCINIMKRDLEWVMPTDTVLTAARLMNDTNVGFLPVCDKDARVVGVLTDRDITTRVAALDKLPSGTKVADVMTTELVTCAPEDDLRVAEKAMSENNKSRIVVTNAEGVLAGVISLTDLLERESTRRAAETARRVTAREIRTT